MSPVTQVIASTRDPMAAKADYVWDALSIQWADDLAKSEAKLVRQYSTARTVSSGLEGTW